MHHRGKAFHDTNEQSQDKTGLATGNNDREGRIEKKVVQQRMQKVIIIL